MRRRLGVSCNANGIAKSIYRYVDDKSMHSQLSVNLGQVIAGQVDDSEKCKAHIRTA